jgi:hypothetical protein
MDRRTLGGDYEAFYQLAHALSERALTAMIDISTRAQVLKTLHEMTPLDTFADPYTAQTAENTILHLVEFAQSAVKEIRRFFWPRLATEDSFHETNQGRWAPYDDHAWSPYGAQVWDAFFADFVRFMTPRLHTMATHIQELRAVETLSGVAVRPDGSKYLWRIGEYIPQEAYYRLKVLLDESGFEATLFADRDNRKGG